MVRDYLARFIEDNKKDLNDYKKQESLKNVNSESATNDEY